MRARVVVTLVPTLFGVGLTACSLIAAPILDNAASGDATAHDAHDDAGSLCNPVDCTNPECVSAGYQCVPLPAGFRYGFRSDAGCASTDTTETYWVDASAPAASCACGCTNPDCEKGTWLESNGSACTSLSSNTAHAVDGGGCTADPVLKPGMVNAQQLSPAPPVGGGCDAPILDVADAGARTLCVPPQGSTGCNAGSVCVRTGASACALADAGATCPSDFAMSSTVATAFDDQRSCSACTCTLGCTASLTLFSSSSCVGGTTIQIDGSCATGSGSTSQYQAYTYQGHPSCSGKASVTGGVSVSSVATLCCGP